MVSIRRQWWMAGLMGLASLGAGCNPLLFPAFLFGPEPREEARLKKLASTDKKKEVKVVILPYLVGLETRQEFIGADYLLSDLLARQLKKLFEFNEEKVKIVSPQKVEDFKNKHAAWRKEVDLQEIGRNFQADFVICLEISSLSLYEKGSANQIYRGRANIKVSVLEVNDAEDAAMPRDYSYVYPSDARGGVAVDIDTPPSKFREQFLNYVAKQVAWLFSAHPTSHTYYDVDE
jgi:hypothetical protein